MIEGRHTYTNRGFLRKATFVEVAKWVSESWRNVYIKTIKGISIKARIIVPTISNNDCSAESSSSDEEDADDPETEIDSGILLFFNSHMEDENFD